MKPLETNTEAKNLFFTSVNPIFRNFLPLTANSLDLVANGLNIYGISACIILENYFSFANF